MILPPLQAYIQDQGAKGYEKFSDYLNKGDTASKNELKKLPGFVSGEDAVKPGTDQLTCLETMERLNSDFLPVVDEKLKYVGMVERNKNYHQPDYRCDPCHRRCGWWEITS